jgi:enterochelin esterase family protein
MRHARLALTIIVLSAPPINADAGPKNSAPDSPRVRALATAVRSGRAAAVDSFWAEMKEKGTPLVEPMSGKKDYVWLTFLWRGDGKTNNVVLVGNVATGHSYDNRLSHLAGSDVWFLTLPMRNDLRATYRFSVNDSLTKSDWSDEAATRRLWASYQKDHLNARQSGGSSLVELAGAPVHPWVKKNKEAPEGNMEAEKVSSAILGNERQVTVYLPPGYDSKAPAYPALFLFDRTAYLYLVPGPTILDNLIHAGKIPPLVAVLIDNPPGARNKELPCNEAFARFLAEELLPRIRRRYNVSIDPKLNCIAGSSYGGLAASFFALRHPEMVGNVLSQSGSYWWGPRYDNVSRDPVVEGGEWLTRQYAASPRKGLRFYLEVGAREDMRVENRHFRDVLIARDYEVVRYSEYNGGHDYASWRGSLADGLIALFGKKE